jgi:SAM-dependent methyltransferase
MTASMTPVLESILYRLARAFYRTEVCHSAAMKDALVSLDRYDRYRAEQIGTVLEAARRYGVALVGRDVLDFGCADGALTPGYRDHGAKSVVGVDIDATAIERACKLRARPGVSFAVSVPDRVPLPDESVDVVVSYDVFEHVSRPQPILDELYRVLRPGGQVLIGTWGWYHPFAHHLFAAMPVPWAHVLFGERVLLRAARRVYHSPWYVPDQHDLDAHGRKKPNKYTNTELSPDYLNKLLIRDFERLFRESRFRYRLHPVPFNSRYARWTRAFLRVPWVREFVTGYLWVVLGK